MPKPGGGHSSGISLGDALRLPKRHPAWRRREAQPGSCMERENLAGDAKGKSTSGSNREAESTDAPERGGLPRSSDEVGQCPWSEGGGLSSLSAGQLGQTGRSSTVQRKAAAGDTSRMNREVQVRICEGLGVKLPGSTRPRPKSRPAASGSAFWGETVAAATCSAWPLVTHCGSRLCDAAIETLATCARDWATSQKCPFETRGLPP